MEILVTGGTGVLGRRVVSDALARAWSVRVLSRGHDVVDGAVLVRGDLATGAGVPDAVDGVQAVIHCATDGRRWKEVDIAGTERLVDLAVRAGVRHLALPGIVGSDIVPLRYYRAKVRAEEMISASGIGWTLLRSTQFHQFVWGLASRLPRLPVVPAPHDTRFQPLDPAVVAARLVDAVANGPAGRLPDVGGRHAYEASELVRSVQRALGRDPRIIRINVPGITGAALRAGANLTPNRTDEGESWNEFVQRRVT